MALKITALIQRAIKGSPLTAAEGDSNWQTIQDFCNSIGAYFSTVLNNDGTLKSSTVATAALQPNSVTPAKLSFQSVKYFEDSSATADVYVITPDPALTAYVTGVTVYMRPAKNNTGACTLNINGLGAVAIHKNGNLDLAADDLVNGGVHIFTYEDGFFQLVGKVNAIQSATQAEMESASSVVAAVTPGRIRYAPSAAKAFVRFSTAGTIVGTPLNVSSVVRNSAGKYTVTFSTAMADANYAPVCSVIDTPASGFPVSVIATNITSSTFDVWCGPNGYEDNAIAVVVFGDFA